jgi:HEAT repeat protein
MPLFKKNKSKGKVDQLVKAGDVAGLIAVITGPNPALERADAVHELPRFSEEVEARHMDAAHAALTSAVQDPDAEVRCSALFAVGEFRWVDSVERLIAGTHDSEWMVRVFATTILGRFPGERTVGTLGTVVARDAEGMVREAAASSLGELADPNALEPLRRAAAEDPDREVRKAAKGAVKRLESGPA